MKAFIQMLAASGLVFASLAHAGPVNINTANAATLAKELKGVGPAKAEAIVKDRAAHGAFKTAQGITRVDSIGQAICMQNKADIKIKD